MTSPPVTVVDSEALVTEFIKTISVLPNSPPSLYLDLEGENLSRDGNISLITIYVQPTHHVYLIDVYNLKSKSFTTAGPNGQTLKDILESNTIIKVFFDVRNDSDALYSHYGIALQGIEDIQLMENAYRKYGRRCVNGLQKCIMEDAPLSLREKQSWLAVKSRGKSLFDPGRAGSYEVFNKRPLDSAIQDYCVNDVQFLPRLRVLYCGRLNKTWTAKVEVETRKRVKESQSPSYAPHGRDKALGPWPSTSFGYGYGFDDY